MDDDVVGDEVAQARHVDVVGLFFPDVLDRLDLVPPDVGVAQLLEGGRAGRHGQLGDETRRGAALANVPVVVAGPPSRLAHVGPRTLALRQQDLVPDLDRQGVGVGRPRRRRETLQNLDLFRLLARNRNQLTETPQTLLRGDPDLAGDFPGALVDGSLEGADRGHDPETQEQVLHVACETLADRRVADLRKPIAAIHVPVAGVHHAEKAGDLLVGEAEDRIGDELLGRFESHQAVAAQHARDRVPTRSPTGAQVRASRRLLTRRLKPDAILVRRPLDHSRNARSRAVAIGRCLSGDRPIGDQGTKEDDLGISQFNWVRRTGEPTRHGNPHAERDVAKLLPSSARQHRVVGGRLRPPAEAGLQPIDALAAVALDRRDLGRFHLQVRAKGSNPDLFSTLEGLIERANSSPCPGARVVDQGILSIALSHSGSRRDDDQVPWLEPPRDRVDVAKAGGGAGQLQLAGGELLEPVDLVVEDLGEQFEVARLLLVRDIEEQLLGPLGELPRFAVALMDPALDLLPGAEQAAQQRVLLDDLGVMLGVARRGHLGRQLGDVVLAAGLLDPVALGQRLDHTELVDGLGGRVEIVDGGEDRRVLLQVEVGGVQLDLVDHPGQRRLGDQHRPQHRFLRLDVLRRDVGCGSGSHSI